MNIPVAAANEKRVAQKAAASEAIHKMVIKVISWKSGLMAGASIISTNKISQKEWNKYKRHILTISKTESKERVLGKLRETQELISKNGGFE